MLALYIFFLCPTLMSFDSSEKLSYVANLNFSYSLKSNTWETRKIFVALQLVFHNNYYINEHNNDQILPILKIKNAFTR